MKHHHPTLALVMLALIMTITFCACQSALAQAPTTVQLPTFQVFSVNTTVSVPDGGGALLGGINRAADRSVTRGAGPLANRGISSTRSASNISVNATIIDHQELDEAVLAQAAARRSSRGLDASQIATNQKADFITRNLAQADRPAREATTNPGPGVEEIRRRNDLAAADRNAEAAEQFAKGEAAEAKGKCNVAKIYYQMAARNGAGSLRDRANERLAVLQSPGKPSLAAQ
jgi:hypothetical protein